MQHKGTVYIHWYADGYSGKSGGRYSYDAHDFSRREDGGGLAGYTLLGTVDIECEIADFDPRQVLVETLKAEKADVIATATRKAGQLEEKIQQLLALPAGESLQVEAEGLDF